MRPCVKQMFIHSLTFAKNLLKCGHSLAFSVRLYVVRKPLRKIFARKESYVRGEKEKKEKNIGQSRLNCIRLNVLFDYFSYEQIKKMTTNEKELSIAIQKYPVIFDKVTRTFIAKM